MILDICIEMKVNNRHKKYYIDKGYNIKKDNLVTIKIEDLLKNSNVKINVKCDVCENIKKLSYHKYNKNIKYYNYYSCSNKCAVEKNKKTFYEKYGNDTNKIVEKIKETKLKKYGNENYNNIEKTKQTCLLKYGTENYFASEEFLNKNSIDNLSDWKKYKILVRKYTRRNKNKLFNQWNGYDYYDNEFIKNNLNLSHLDKKYPTIDHKISVYEGFIKNKSPEEIGDLSNLCITKRYINSSKGKTNYLSFSTSTSSNSTSEVFPESEV